MDYWFRLLASKMKNNLQNRNNFPSDCFILSSKKALPAARLKHSSPWQDAGELATVCGQYLLGPHLRLQFHQHGIEERESWAQEVPFPLSWVSAPLHLLQLRDCQNKKFFRVQSLSRNDKQFICTLRDTSIHCTLPEATTKFIQCIAASYFHLWALKQLSPSPQASDILSNWKDQLQRLAPPSLLHWWSRSCPLRRSLLISLQEQKGRLGYEPAILVSSLSHE